MSEKPTAKNQRKPVYKLREKKAFDYFIKVKPMAIIVVYHYICPQCDSYLKQFRQMAFEYKKEEQLNFAKIHIQLKWMIEEANLTGDIEEENTFLLDYEVGSKVPATMFFKNGILIWKIEGVLSPPIFRGLIKKLKDENQNEIRL